MEGDPRPAGNRIESRYRKTRRPLAQLGPCSHIAVTETYG